MRRLPLTLLSLIALGACSDGPPPPLLPQQGVRASFPPGAVVNVIHVDALDALPLRGAELVAPDGTTTSANYLKVDRMPRSSGGQSTFDDPWRGSALDFNGGTQLPNAGLGATVRGQDTLLLMVSTAEIPLPDPVSYRRDWANYRIRVNFGGVGGHDTQEIPAPKPPPAS